MRTETSQDDEPYLHVPRGDRSGDKDGDTIHTGTTTETGTDANSTMDPDPPTTSTAHATNGSANAATPGTDEVLPGLPRLNYNLWHYKTKLLIITSLLVIESSLLPIALYYGLSQTSLRSGIIFAIITSFFGIVTGIEFGLRSLKLIKVADTYRPLQKGSESRRWKFDFTHMTLSFGYTVMTAILVGASIPHPPLVRPLAIPVSLFLIQMGIQLLWSGWMSATKRPAPFKISSVEKGETTPPLVFTIVEDIVAVDGGAGKDYRRNLLARYRASPRFRKMIAQQNWFWAVGALVDGVGTMVVIWTVSEPVAYGVGEFFFFFCPPFPSLSERKEMMANFKSQAGEAPWCLS